MAKRRLTKQQLKRIRANQASQDISLDDGSSKNLDAIDDSSLGEQQRGLVISHHGQQLSVESAADKNIYRCYARSNLPALATGDEVIWRRNNQDESQSGIIESLVERRSVIERPHVHRGLKPIAANIDILAIVIAPEPEPFPNLIDRYLVAATKANLKSILILNKTDLLDNEKEYTQRFEIYRSLGYPLLAISAVAEKGMDTLRQHLNNNISIFVGQSGVGKSSLLNCLLPDADIKVGKLSHAKAKGKHTTTAAQLFHLNTGGSIIDSPGIREFGLWHLDKDDVAQGFIEFQDFLGACKFRDCQHTHPAHCAIHQAVADGKISEQRLTSYFAIINSLDSNQLPL